MNTNLITIDNMLLSTISFADNHAAQTTHAKNSTQFTSTTDTYSHPYNPEPITTDNKPTVAQNEIVDKPKQDFKQTLQKTVTIESNQQNQNNKPDKQLTISETSTNTNNTQSISTREIPLTFEAIVKENALKMEPKTSRQLSQLIAKLKKDGKSPPVTGQEIESNETELLLAAKNGQLGIKNVLPETSNGQTGLKNGLPDASRKQFGLQTALSNISKNTPVNDTHPGQTKIEEKVLSNTTIETTKAQANIENTTGLMPEALVDMKGNKAVNNEKTSILGNSVVTDGIKSPNLNGNKLETDTLAGDGAKTTKEDVVLTDKSLINTNEKILESNTNFQQTQNKFIKQDSQLIEIAPEKSINSANKTSVSKTTNFQEIPEPSDSKSKETSNTGNKISDDLVVLKLNITDVHVSSIQTKNNNSTKSINNSNSKLDQILTHNNHETPVTTQSTGSTEGAKTLDMPAHTSTSSNSAGISKQIYESIQSSFSQEGRNQQITVQLNPPELGRVIIKFQEQDQHITGLLEVNKTQTKVEIEQAIPQIIRDLQNSGIQIKRLDVVLSQQEQSEQGALREQTLQNGWARQQGSYDSNYTGDNNPDVTEINEWLTNNNSYHNISELQETLTANGSINMLI